MKSTKLFAAIATFAVAGSVFAQEYVQPDAGFVSTKSRAEVIAELSASGGSTALQLVDSNYPAINVTSTRSRDEVVAELNAARQDGSLNVPEHSYPVIVTDSPSKTREQVREELAVYLAKGGRLSPVPN